MKITPGVNDNYNPIKEIQNNTALKAKSSHEVPKIIDMPQGLVSPKIQEQKKKVSSSNDEANKV